MSVSIILFVSLITYTSSIKLATYNTYQIFTNPLASTLRDPQIEQIGDSDVDVLCLQELALMKDVVEYTQALADVGYPNTFSLLNVQQEFSPENLITPRIPCDSSQIDALNSTCARTCQSLYPDIAWAGCLATLCPSDFDQVLYSECIGCLALYAGIQSFVAALGHTSDFNGAASFCLNPPDTSAFPGGVNFAENLYNLTDGAAIATKTEYPIKNTWSYILPSWIIGEKRLYVAEIDICTETNPDNDECEDSIIVGCTHLEPTAYITDTNVVQSPRLNEPDITSHVGLNRLQTQFIIDNVFNDDILATLGRDSNADNVFGVFLMGDTNNGELLPRCQYVDDEGNTNADNCELPDDAPLNPYDIFGDNHLINGRDITYKAVLPKEGLKCTSCIDPAEDDFNILAVDDSGTFIDDPETSRDLDHIFVQDGYCKNFKRVKSVTDFMDAIVEIPATGLGDLVCPEPVGVGTCVELCSGDDSCSDGQLCCSNGCGHVCMDGVELVPASDHYAVTLDIDFKCNGGGRGKKGKCVRGNKRGKRRRP